MRCIVQDDDRYLPVGLCFVQNVSDAYPLHEPGFCVIRLVQDDSSDLGPVRRSVLRPQIVSSFPIVILRSPRRPKDLRLFSRVHAIQCATVIGGFTIVPIATQVDPAWIQ